MFSVVGANLNKPEPRPPGAAFVGFSARAINCIWLSARALPGACWSARDDLCWLQLSTRPMGANLKLGFPLVRKAQKLAQALLTMFQATLRR